MKTIHVSARLKHIDKKKIYNYFNNPNIRKLLETIIKLSENNSYIRNKIIDELKKDK